MATTPTGTVLNFNQLLFGDRFRFVGDLDGTSYGPVLSTQNYVDGSFSVVAAGATEDTRSAFAKVLLLHREPSCEHGVHPDLCWDSCWAL